MFIVFRFIDVVYHNANSLINIVGEVLLNCDLILTQFVSITDLLSCRGKALRLFHLEETDSTDDSSLLIFSIRVVC